MVNETLEDLSRSPNLLHCVQLSLAITLTMFYGPSSNSNNKIHSVPVLGHPSEHSLHRNSTRLSDPVSVRSFFVVTLTSVSPTFRAQTSREG